MRTVPVRELGYALEFRFLGLLDLSGLSDLSDLSGPPSPVCIFSSFVPALKALLGHLLAFAAISCSVAADIRLT